MSVKEPTPERSAIFTRGAIATAAEVFVVEALLSLGLIWEPEEIAAEVSRLTDRAFGWRDAH